MSMVDLRVVRSTFPRALYLDMARLTTRGLIWRSSPTSFQAWLRVSNILDGGRGAGIVNNDGGIERGAGRWAQSCSTMPAQ